MQRWCDKLARKFSQARETLIEQGIQPGCEFCRGNARKLLLDDGWNNFGIRSYDKKMQKRVLVHNTSCSTFYQDSRRRFAQKGCYSLIDQPYGFQVRLCNLLTGDRRGAVM